MQIRKAIFAGHHNTDVEQLRSGEVKLMTRNSSNAEWRELHTLTSVEVWRGGIRMVEESKETDQMAIKMPGWSPSGPVADVLYYKINPPVTVEEIEADRNYFKFKNLLEKYQNYISNEGSYELNEIEFQTSLNEVFGLNLS